MFALLLCLLSTCFALDDGQTFFFVQSYSYGVRHPCNTTQCQGRVQVSLSGPQVQSWMSITPKPRDPFVVSPWMSRAPPVWGYLYDTDSTGGQALEGSISVTYTVDVPNVGTASVDIALQLEVASYELVAQSIDYDNFQTTSPLLSWGLYSNSIFVLCYCPTPSACPDIICNQGS